MKRETLIRGIFHAWHTRDWAFVESVLAADFTFTSQYDDHIDKHEYKRRCWNSIEQIELFELVSIVEQGDEAFVRYKGQVNGTQVQNIEHFTFRDGQVRTIDVFFGRP